MIRVAIANQQKHVKLDRRGLTRLVRAVFGGESVRDAEISLAFVDDARIAEINVTYLRHKGPTDVITFPLSETRAAGRLAERVAGLSPAAPPVVGEVVVSAETAQRVAAELGHDAKDELALYVVHGCLHLCGYDDHTPAQRGRMRRRERHYLDRGERRAASGGV